MTQAINFHEINSGTNTAGTFVLGSGASFNYSGSGILNAKSCLFPTANAVQQYIAGNYYSANILGGALTSVAGAATRWDMQPVIFSTALTIDQLGIACTVAVASALLKITIYSSDANGNPTALLRETGDLDMSTTGFKSEAWAFTFEMGKVYWVGARHNSNATVQAIAAVSSISFGAGGTTTAVQFNGVRRTLAYATPATNPYAYTSADLVAGITCPAVKWRAA